jgi:hypothetical protein
MLSAARIIAFVPSRDLQRAMAFYVETLGLRFIRIPRRKSLRRGLPLCARTGLRLRQRLCAGLAPAAREQAD